MPRPILPLVIALIAGTAVGYLLRLPDLPLLASLLLIFSFFFLALIKKRGGIILPLAACALFIIGILNINHSIYRLPEAGHVVYHISKEKLTIEGIIDEDPQESPDGKTLIVAVRAIVKEPPWLVATTKHENPPLPPFSKGGIGDLVFKDYYTPAEGLIMLSLPLPDVPLQYGDLIRARTRLRVPHNFQNPGSFDYAKQLRGRGILVQGRVNNASDIAVIREGQGNTFKMWVENFRNRLRKIIAENTTTPQREIILALLLGEKKLIPQSIREVFNRTGTSHILAISGLHVGMIASLSIFFALLIMKTLPFLLLRFNAINAASFFALMPVAAYACIAGLGISVIRAAIMIIVFLIAVLIRKERELLNTLALAAFIILVLNPSALFDVSFQLSFTAVATLILAAPVITSLFIKNYTGDGLKAPSFPTKVAYNILLFVFVSLIATLGTLPLIAYYFNGISTVSLPANGVIVPLMGMIALPIGMAVIIVTPLSTALAALLVKAASFFVETALTAIGFLSSLPGAFLTVATPSLPEIACYYLFLAVIIKMIGERKDETIVRTDNVFYSPKFLKLVLALLVVFFVFDYTYYAFKDNFRTDLRITAIDVGQGSSTLIHFA
jgi:competence protein ComEC